MFLNCRVTSLGYSLCRLTILGRTFTPVQNGKYIGTLCFGYSESLIAHHVLSIRTSYCLIRKAVREKKLK